MVNFNPQPCELRGDSVVLQPMRPEDAASLQRAIGLPEVFAGGYGGGSAGLTTDPIGFQSFVDTYYPWQTGCPYLVRASDGHVVGTSSLADIDPIARSAHIGWTAYHPSAWGSRVNPECKLLLLGHAFDGGAERVKLQADAINERSRAAILKLGATFEGVLRHDRLRADGSWRSTAIYSILSEEWPEVRAGLHARLSQEPA